MKKNRKAWMKLGVVVLAVMFAVSMAGCAPEPDPDPYDVENDEPGKVSVGSKEFTEQLILGQIAIMLLEDAGFEVDDNTGLGGTVVVREALEAGEIDLYWEYTGTAWITHLGHDEAITDPQECYDRVSEADLENGIVWLDYTPFDNTYTIMMRQEDAEDLGIETISDLAEMINAGERPLGDWVFATDHEYSVRDDGYPGLTELYGFEFDDVAIMDLGITYGALRDGDVPLAMGFATDGRIAGFNLVNLVDDKQFHPVYNCSPNVRQDVLDQYPQIADILNQVSPRLDADTMSSLNAAVDIDGYEPDEVAREWLEEEGLL